MILKLRNYKQDAIGCQSLDLLISHIILTYYMTNTLLYSIKVAYTYSLETFTKNTTTI